MAEKKKINYMAVSKANKALDDIRPLNDEQHALTHSIRNNLITMVDGVFGSGKTFLAFVEGMKMLNANKIARIIYIRPHVPAIGTDKDLGYLPGTQAEKLLAMHYPIYDNLDGIIPRAEVTKMIEAETLSVTTPSFLRGRSLKDTLVIADEFQNADYSLYNLVISRLGTDSKLIILGCSQQIDLRNHGQSFLQEACKKLTGMESVGVCKLEKVVRHSLTQRIIERLAE